MSFYSTSAIKVSGLINVCYQDDRDLTDVLHKGRYVIQNISRNDEGDYMCEATNQGGSKSVSATVDVKSE